MKNKNFKLFLSLFFFEGIAVLIVYFAIPSEVGSQRLLGLSTSRLVIAAGIVLVLLCSALGLIHLRRENTAYQKVSAKLDHWMIEQQHLFPFQIGVFFAWVFFIELFFLTFIFLPPFTQPLLIWAILATAQLWLLLRLSYAHIYQARIPFWQRIRMHWRAFTSTQRRTALILAGLGLAYFCTFIPLNTLGWNGPKEKFVGGIDENIQYPIAVYTLTRGDTFASTVYHLMVNEDDVYGHPYVTLESLILVPSRLVFGNDFGNHYQLNLLLLRQFICVLPMVLAMYLLVYMLTHFHSFFPALGLFLLLLSIPGTVKFNIRFLHPDALILLLIVLTIFFLQKDSFRYRKYFYLAAVTCSLAAVIKLWGFFFFLAIAFYLFAGVVKKSLTLKKSILAGCGFVLIMGATIFISDPELLIPNVARQQFNGIVGQINNRSQGYTEPGSEDIYQKNFPTWMKFFKEYYIQEYYFFFCFACLALCSLWGKRKLTAQMMLCWCLAIAIYMIYFLAAKSYWYMMELMVPLYTAPFLLPELSEGKLTQKITQRAKPSANTLLWGITALFCASQFAFNLVSIISNPVILAYAH